MLAFVLFPTAHVPSYGNSADGCYTPPHHHSVSQAFYIRGSGGLELHITSPTTPFDIPGGELVDFDAVFARQYDQTTYDVYVGCGGCVASMDPIVIPPVALDGYEKAEVEPLCVHSLTASACCILTIVQCCVQHPNEVLQRLPQGGPQVQRQPACRLQRESLHRAHR